MCCKNLFPGLLRVLHYKTNPYRKRSDFNIYHQKCEWSLRKIRYLWSWWAQNRFLFTKISLLYSTPVLYGDFWLDHWYNKYWTFLPFFLSQNEIKDHFMVTSIFKQKFKVCLNIAFVFCLPLAPSKLLFCFMPNQLFSQLIRDCGFICWA